MRSTHLWLLETAVCGLVNSNEKWQYQSNKVLLDFESIQSEYAPQLFYKIGEGNVTLIVAKIADDLMITRPDDNAGSFRTRSNDKFTYGSITTGPKHLPFLL